MGRFTKDTSGGEFVAAPLGTHVARCYRIIDIGTQMDEYQGKAMRRNKIIVGFELPDEMVETEEGSKPIIVSRFYTNSLADKATLRHDLEAWRGRAFSRDELARFDLENIIGKPCMVTIVGGEGDKTKVSAVSGVPKSVQVPLQINPSFTLWLDEFSQDKFESLSDGLQNLIKKSEEYRQMVDGNGVVRNNNSESTDDDIPF